MNSEQTKQYARCECPDASWNCCGGRGPAVWEVIRDGQVLKLCTHCDLAEDLASRRLIIDGSYDARTLTDFDPLGAFVVIGELRYGAEGRGA